MRAILEILLFLDQVRFKIFGIILLTVWGVGCSTTMHPIPSKSIEVFAPVYMEPSEGWNRITRILLTSDYGNVIIHWQGFGGDVGFSDFIIGVIQHAQRRGVRVTINIVGAAISAHSIPPCYATKVTYNHGYYIFHAAFNRDSNDQKIYVPRWFVDLFQDSIYQCVMTGVLTEQDIDVILEDHKRITVYPDGKKQVEEDWT